jgi:predicted membrane protein
MEEIKMNRINENRSSRGRLIIGLVLLLVGLGLIANQLDLIPYNLHRIIFTWQSLLILIGIIMVTGRENKFTGYILIGIGGFFLIPYFIDVPSDYRNLFWPIFLVILGLIIIFRTSLFTRGNIISGDDNYINDVNVFGGHERKINSNEFKGGKITSTFGGGTYDLRTAKLANGVNILDLVNVFGGCKLIVPPDWEITVEVVAVFGGFSDKRYNLPTITEKSGKQLIIKGIAIFGGGELTSA